MRPAAQTVLIVDDDVALRDAFARALEHVGYEVVAVTGTPAVVDLIVAHQPGMILLDNHMPEASGIELIRLIRDRWSRDEVPIVLISGSSLQGEIDQALDAGANDVRRKPVELAELISTVRGALQEPPSPDPEQEGPVS
ncbi:MAG: response regulator [Microthrixaceae bacterium]